MPTLELPSNLNVAPQVDLAMPAQEGGQTDGRGEPAGAAPNTPLSVPRLRPAAPASARRAPLAGPPPAATPQGEPLGHRLEATSARVAALLLDGRRDGGGGGGGGNENVDANGRAADIVLPSPDRPPAQKGVWSIGALVQGSSPDPTGGSACVGGGGGRGEAPLEPPEGAFGAGAGPVGMNPNPNPVSKRRGVVPGGSRLGRKRKVEPDGLV